MHYGSGMPSHPPTPAEGAVSLTRRAKMLWALLGAVTVCVLVAGAFALGALTSPRPAQRIPADAVTRAAAVPDAMDPMGLTDIRTYALGAVDGVLGTDGRGARCFGLQSSDDSSRGAPGYSPPDIQYSYLTCVWPPQRTMLEVDGSLQGMLPEGADVRGIPRGTRARLVLGDDDALEIWPMAVRQ